MTRALEILVALGVGVVGVFVLTFIIAVVWRGYELWSSR